MRNEGKCTVRNTHSYIQRGEGAEWAASEAQFIEWFLACWHNTSITSWIWALLLGLWTYTFLLTNMICITSACCLCKCFHILFDCIYHMRLWADCVGFRQKGNQSQLHHLKMYEWFNLLNCSEIHSPSDVLIVIPVMWGLNMIPPVEMIVALNQHV